MNAEDNDELVDVIELEENLADAEKPKEIPAGKYVGEIQDVQLVTSQKGNPYYGIQFRIPPSELAPDVAEQYEDGAVLYWNRVMKPKGKTDRRSIYNLKKFVEALGLDSNVTTIDPNDWMGCRARLVVRDGKYLGENRAEISAVEAAEAKPAPARGKQQAAPAAKRGRK